MPALDPVAAAARAQEPDRYLAALYAPEPGRRRLIALAAFQGEITRIPTLVREPLLAEIRLQWWRDAVLAVSQGDVTGNPLADSLSESFAAKTLPIGLLLGMIDAASVSLATPDVNDPQALRMHLNKSHGAAFSLAARALGAAHSSALETAAREAGLAYGLARLAADAFAERREQQMAEARIALAAAAITVAGLDTALLPGFLPLAMVEPYLAQAHETRGNQNSSALRRWWRLWRAQVTGRLT